MPHLTAHQLRQALSDVDFPADKDALLEQARSDVEEVDRALRSLPPAVTYDNPDEVVRSVTVDLGGGLPPRRQAAVEDHGRSGVAERVREPRES